MSKIKVSFQELFVLYPDVDESLGDNIGIASIIGKTNLSGKTFHEIGIEA